MKYYGITNRGLVRKNNQDSYVIATNEVSDVFAIVCDGIGGNSGGDIASRMAVAYFSKAFSENKGFTDIESAKTWIRRCVSASNTEIFEYGKSHPKLKGMGTTLCGVMITRLGKFVVNIGDSRAYGCWSDGRFRQLTVDHTLVNDMLLHGELTREEAENFPRKNVLTNALGVWESVRCDIDVHEEDLRGMLLCSDGLHGYVKENEIRKILFGELTDPNLRCRKLMKAALDAGGFDNITVVLIDWEGDLYHE
ncbi:MAG: Stp1/IreP family PP2C-type Ser/Thr phosphatase [Solobacterium sp.]|nr:Stp1/IreP family PP2C-type Ser/Thr phosphatase [Solobacterium sp.]